METLAILPEMPEAERSFAPGVATEFLEGYSRPSGEFRGKPAGDPGDGEFGGEGGGQFRQAPLGPPVTGRAIKKGDVK